MYQRYVPYSVAQITPISTYVSSLIVIKQTRKLRPSSRDNVVCVSTSYGLDCPGNPRRRNRFSVLQTHSAWPWGSHWAPGEIPGNRAASSFSWRFAST